MGLRVKEGGGSEGRPVIGRIGAVALPGNRADFPLVLAYVNRGQTDLRKQSRNVGGVQHARWCGFRRFRCWLPRSNVQVTCTANAGNRVLSEVRWPMLELHAWKHARAVLRGGGEGDLTSLPDQRTAALPADCAG